MQGRPWAVERRLAMSDSASSTGSAATADYTVVRPEARAPTAGFPQFFGHDLLGFDFQFTRALGAQTYGGSELGECWVTARRIKNHDIESWYQEWFAAAERLR